MIHQICQVKAQTERLPELNQGFDQVRRLQAQLKARRPKRAQSTGEQFWSPMTAGPYLVPVSRWVE
jgi:hypothetical protein